MYLGTYGVQSRTIHATLRRGVQVELKLLFTHKPVVLRNLMWLAENLCIKSRVPSKFHPGSIELFHTESRRLRQGQESVHSLASASIARHYCNG